MKFSVELCAPKTATELTRLLAQIHTQLQVCVPEFWSITCPQPSLKQERSRKAKELAWQLQQVGLEAKRPVMPHLPAHGLTKVAAAALVTDYLALGINRFLVLSGDKSAGPAGDFAYATDLLKFLQTEYGQSVQLAAACHPLAFDLEFELSLLKQKVELGAQLIITQAIFDIEKYAKFWQASQDLKLGVPIITGILPFGVKAAADFLLLLQKLRLQITEEQLSVIKQEPLNLLDQATTKRLTLSLIKQLRDLGVDWLHVFSFNEFKILNSFIAT